MIKRQLRAVWLILLVLWGCAASPRFASGRGGARSGTPAAGGNKEASPGESVPTETPRVKAPEGKALLTLEGVASYYAHEFHGRLTSNGETFDMHSLTAAHRTLPFGTKLRVTNLENNKTVMVRINDRGPFKEGRIIDLAMGAAKELDMIRNGTARVRLEVLEWGTGE